MTRRAIFLSLVLLAACARSEDASVVVDTNELSAQEVRTTEQDDEELALGAWRESLQDEHAALEFGPNGAPPLFSLRCDERRSVFLQRHGAAPSGDLPVMLISIGSETRRLAVTNVGGAVPMLRASLAPSDTLVETFATAATPITVRVGAAPPMVLPPSPNIGQFLGNCEGGPRQSAGGNESAGNASAEANSAEPATPAPARR